MKYKYSAKDLFQLAHVAGNILKDAGDFRFFALFGEMGVGKTALVKALCKSLEVEDEASSPTFSIMNEYRRRNGEPVYHFDFYRIKKESEAYDIGYEHFFFDNNYCFVEWPEKIESLLDFPKATIFITSENGIREIRMVTD